MNKCLKIMISGDIPKHFLRDVLQKNAKKLNLEGIVQAAQEGMFRIIVCGDKDAVDSFLDLLHKAGIVDLEIEPFLKDKDYRGVFRIIE